MFKLLLAYHHFPIYRKAVLEEICSSEFFEVTLISDVSIRGRDLSVLSESQLIELAGDGNTFSKASNYTFFGHVLWQSGVLRHVLSTDHDVVILLGDYKIVTYWLCLFICRFRKIKTLLWTHGLLRPDQSIIKRHVRKMFYELSDGLLLYGNKAQILLSSILKKDVKLTVVGNSVDYKRISEYVQLDNSFRNPRKLVYIGRVNASKNLEILFEAMQMIEHDVSLDIIGDGDSVPNLRRLAAGFGSTRIKFHGEINDEKLIANVMNSASVSVIPGDVGLSAIHSLSYGLSVVTHDRFDLHKPEVEALTESGCGYFYVYEDAQDLAKQIVKALDQAASCRSKCIDTIEGSFTPESQLHRIEGAVRDLISA